MQKEFSPKIDSAFMNSFKHVYSGNLKAYFANIPGKSIHLFDNEFLANALKIDKKGVESSINIQKEWISVEEGMPLWVYPKDGEFVLSDDYFSYEGYRRLGFDYFPCIVLGDPFAAGVEDIEGPLELIQVKELILASIESNPARV